MVSVLFCLFTGNFFPVEQRSKFSFKSELVVPTGITAGHGGSRRMVHTLRSESRDRRDRQSLDMDPARAQVSVAARSKSEM